MICCVVFGEKGISLQLIAHEIQILQLPVQLVLRESTQNVDNFPHKLFIASDLPCIDAIEIRIPFVPGCNDSNANLEAAGRFLGSLRGITCVRLLPYHSLARSKYLALGLPDTMPHVEPPDDGQLRNAAEILNQYGLNARSGRE